jgi:poly-gamma-glutamate synthesis protein (capsule biosynthesis protein)
MDPFAGIAPLLRGASFAAANLECTISDLGDSTHRYAFRAPTRSAQLLHRAGFEAMGLANNHALDFGAAALHDCAARLVREKIEPIGIGKPGSNACTPSFFSVLDKKKIALLAISDVGHGARIDRANLDSAIAIARSQANFVACLVHWGIENSENVTDEQREFARWLIDHGIDLVVGSHPHCVQPLDFYHGCPIAYSLGNLVFDGAPAIASWNHSALLKVSLDQNAKASSVSAVPLVLEAGFPQIDAAADKTNLSSVENFQTSAAVAP